MRNGSWKAKWKFCGFWKLGHQCHIEWCWLLVVVVGCGVAVVVGLAVTFHTISEVIKIAMKFAGQILKCEASKKDHKMWITDTKDC